MDHHCPFIANCVGFTNHKYFMGLLGWGAICTGMFIFEMTYVCWMKHQQVSLTSEIWAVTVFSYIALIYGYVIMICLFILCLLLTIEHIEFVLTNSTTIESSAVKNAEEQNENRILYFKNLKNFFGNFWVSGLPFSRVEKFESYLAEEACFDHDGMEDGNVPSAEIQRMEFYGLEIAEIVIELSKDVSETKRNIIYLFDSYQFSDDT